MAQKVAIASDSTVDIPNATVDALGIGLASVHVLKDGESYRDRIDITTAEANQIMLEGKVRMTTSAASAADWLDAYERLMPLATEVVAISLSPTLSATYAGAVTAGELWEDGNVTVLESKSACASQGLVVVECARLAKDGGTKEEVVALAGSLLARTRMVCTSNYRSFAKQGGRYRQEGEGEGEEDDSLPVWRIWERGWKEIDRADTRQGTLEKVLGWMERDLKELGYQKGQSLKCVVEHIVSDKEAAWLMDEVQKRFAPQFLEMWEIGPTIGVHLGPGCVGVAYLYDEGV